jgi:IclR family transcriptional regulator, acetate operon repressor
VVVNAPQAPLKTVDRALHLLMCFDARQPEWGLTELARHVGWDKSVTQRLLATLMYRGFLLNDPATRRYRLGPTIFALGQLAAGADPLTALVRPVLHEVARRGGETALCTVPDRDEAQCLAAVEGPAAVRYSTRVGGRVPGHAGAGAKVLFAWRPESELRALFGGRTLAHFTASTITDVELLLRDFELIRKMGMSVSEGEIDPDVGAISVPISRGGAVIGAISAVGPLSRTTRERERLVEVLVDAAADLIARLSVRDDTRVTPAAPAPSV